MYVRRILELCVAFFATSTLNVGDEKFKKFLPEYIGIMNIFCHQLFFIAAPPSSTHSSLMSVHPYERP